MSTRDDRQPPQPKRGERTYSDAERIEVLSAVVSCGGVLAAARKTGVTNATIHGWLAIPKWAAKLGEIRQAHAREAEALATSERTEMLKLCGVAREVAAKCAAQQLAIANGENVPKDRRLNVTLALGLVRELTGAAAVLDRALKTVVASPGSEMGGVTVTVVRGESVVRGPRVVGEDEPA